MAIPSVNDMDHPVEGQRFKPDVGTGMGTVPVSGLTDINTQVEFLFDGVVLRTVNTGSAEGYVWVNRNVTLGPHRVKTRAGTPPDTLDSIEVNVMVETKSKPDLVAPVNSYPDLTWYLNWLADGFDSGIPGYTAQYAACIWAEVPFSYSLAGALNTKAGNPVGQWTAVTQVLNQIAQGSGPVPDPPWLPNHEAAYQICVNETPPVPDPQTFSPPEISSAGNSTITIIGVRLALVTSVTIGGKAVTSLNVTDTRITGSAPAGPVGPADVVFIYDGGTLTKTAWVVFEGPPVLSSVSPTTVPQGSLPVMITCTGQNFKSNTTVQARHSTGAYKDVMTRFDSETQIAGSVVPDIAGSWDIRVHTGNLYSFKRTFTVTAGE